MKLKFFKFFMFQLRNPNKDKKIKTSEEQYNDKYKLLMQKYEKEKSLDVGDCKNNTSYVKPIELNTVE